MVVSSENPSESPKGRIQIGPKRKIALVCSGGATKAGAFHLGVALALQEQGFKFFGGIKSSTTPLKTPGPMEISTYVGSSAGSIITSYLAAGYSLENIINSFLGRIPTHADPADLLPKILPRLTYQKMFNLRPQLGREHIGQMKKLRQIFSNLMEGNWKAFIQLKWMKMSGLFSTAGVENFLREEVLLSNQFQDYFADLFIVATQLNHSRKIVFGKYNYQPPPHDLNCQYSNEVGISDACAASIALPLVFAPHAIQGPNQQVTHYIDGEIRETLSTHVAIDGGADLVIASYTHQPLHVPAGGLSLTEHGIPAIVIQSIYLLIEQKINTHRYRRQSHRNAIDAVSRYCRSQNVPEHHRHQICHILEVELNHRMDVDTIYIHPSASDAQLFFGEHFSLNPRKLNEIVKSGFRAAIDALRKYDFADREKKPAMGTTSKGIE